MGMGEPFLNYNNTLNAIRFINNPNYFNIGARKISISTCGIIDGIEKLANEDLQINLAISLHASNNKTRSKIMKVNNKYPIEKIFQVTDKYIAKTDRKVMLEYLLLDGINDQDEHAHELIDLLENRKLYMVNLVTYNPTGEFRKSNRLERFKEILEKANINVTERNSQGQSIKAACGQLVVQELT